jgi:uncharacterized protein YbjT (DUF2867 family)
MKPLLIFLETTMNKILVLGATGNVGRPLVKALVARGEKVRAASRSGRAIEGAQAFAFDFADSATYEPALDGVDRVYLMLPGGYLQITELLMPLIDLAKSRGIKVVMQSVFGVDADDNNPYRQVEKALEDSETAYVILRPNWFADNFHSYWKAGIDHGQISVPAGDGKSSFIDCRDIANAAAAALTTDEYDGNAFNLTGAEALSYADAAGILSDVLGKPISYNAVTDQAFIELLTSAGVPQDYAQFLAAIYYPVREGWTAVVSDAVEKLTGQPPRSIRQYAMDHIEDFR